MPRKSSRTIQTFWRKQPGLKLSAQSKRSQCLRPSAPSAATTSFCAARALPLKRFARWARGRPTLSALGPCGRSKTAAASRGKNECSLARIHNHGNEIKILKLGVADMISSLDFIRDPDVAKPTEGMSLENLVYPPTASPTHRRGLFFFLPHRRGVFFFLPHRVCGRACYLFCL